MLRRSGLARAGAVLRCADLEMDDDAHVVRRAGVEVPLSPTEYNLLRFLLANQGRVLSKAQILDHVWQYDFGGDGGVVETYIGYLRKKVDQVEPRLIHTVRGVRVHAARAERLTMSLRARLLARHGGRRRRARRGGGHHRPHHARRNLVDRVDQQLASASVAAGAAVGDAARRSDARSTARQIEDGADRQRPPAERRRRATPAAPAVTVDRARSDGAASGEPFTVGSTGGSVASACSRRARPTARSTSSGSRCRTSTRR